LLKKSLIPFVLVVVLIGLLITPNEGSAKTYDEVKKQLEDVQRRASEQARRQKEAERQLAQLQKDKEKTRRELEDVKADLERVSLEMTRLQSDILDETVKLQDANDELNAVEQRIEERDGLIRDRLRLLYKKGEVKYLEVLMESTSFSDFLDRMRYLNLIINQDQSILEEQKADKLVKEEIIAGIEAQLALLEGMYKDLELKELELEELRQQKEVMIAQYEQKTEEYEHISEEAQKEVMELAAKAAALNKELESLAFKAGKLAFPLPKRYSVTSGFGTRVDPITGKKGASHTGIDFGAPAGTNILAAADGIVIAAQWVNGYGNYVIIDHGKNDKGQSVWTLYAHMSKISTKEGATVKVGEKIGEVGTTGRSTGNHLHFEVRINQTAVDPAPYLN
jgi:murein DD-endopeptidase MepM/ murein hydrolase activator NlpD